MGGVSLTETPLWTETPQTDLPTLDRDPRTEKPALDRDLPLDRDPPREQNDTQVTQEHYLPAASLWAVITERNITVLLNNIMPVCGNLSINRDKSTMNL